VPILDWMSRKEDVVAAARVPYRMLEAVPGLDGGDADHANMLIQGDNLEALKSLLPFYAGQVKCIYIDPPYNTRSAFEHYDDNLEHAQWLAMIYPRLVLLRELLAEDGSIWVNIDDNEGHYLKVVMDEVFGRRNFFGNVVWQHSVQGKNDAKTISLHHNHLLVFAKTDRVLRNLIPRAEHHNLNYGNADNDPKGPWRSGDVRSPNLRENLKFEVITPSGNVIPPPEKGWRWAKSTFDEKVADGEITFLNNETRVLRKIYLADQLGRVPESIWFGDDVGTTREASAELRLTLADVASQFPTPKPERLIERVIHIATNPGDLVLDSFLGSGTTAAVAHKMGRRWIGIEMGDHAETHCKPRLDKVIAGEQGGISASTGWQGGGGYRYYRLGPPAFDATGRIEPDIGFAALAAHIWWAETGHPAGQLEGERSPILGVHEGVAYALLYNGILGDRSVSGGNVLTAPLLARLQSELPDHDGRWVIYGEACRLSPARLAAAGVIFKQTPYDVKAR
jgi:adenine-specific DNA-methyltransferase